MDFTQRYRQTLFSECRADSAIQNSMRSIPDERDEGKLRIGTARSERSPLRPTPSPSHFEVRLVSESVILEIPSCDDLRADERDAARVFSLYQGHLLPRRTTLRWSVQKSIRTMRNEQKNTPYFARFHSSGTVYSSLSLSLSRSSLSEQLIRISSTNSTLNLL